MQKKTILIIVIITSISLMGIVLTQLYWVNNAIDLKKTQFDNRVRIAMKSVMNQLLERKSDSLFKEHIKVLSCRKDKLDVTDFVEPRLLDSLLNEEMSCMALGRNYNYAIYNRNNNRFVAGNYVSYEAQLIDSPYQFSLNSLYKPGDYFFCIYFPNKTGIFIRQMGGWLLISIIFLIVLVFGFGYTIFSFLKQKKLSEMKNDFVNNMTHELKTPIATSSLAAEMLLRSEVMDNPGRVKKYAEVVLDESHRLQSQVEQVLQIAVLEDGQLKLKRKKSNVHELLMQVIETMDLRIKDSKISFVSDFSARQVMAYVDKVHMVNVFYNLLDNAIKYSPENPQISVSTRNTKKGLHIIFKDNGIGISYEHQKDVFKNLFRVPTGNLHEVRGFGLGLYYVKAIMDLHDGQILLKSELGKGSTFELIINQNLK